MFAPNIPPRLEKINITKYKKPVSLIILPSEKNKRATVINNESGIADANPDRMPFKLHLKDEMKPLIKLPSTTANDKYKFSFCGKYSDLFKIRVKKIEIIKVVIIPITDERTKPKVFCIITGYSFLFESFLCIKKSLTFNKEYEG